MCSVCCIVAVLVVKWASVGGGVKDTVVPWPFTACQVPLLDQSSLPLWTSCLFRAPSRTHRSKINSNNPHKGSHLFSPQMHAGHPGPNPYSVSLPVVQHKVFQNKTHTHADFTPVSVGHSPLLSECVSASQCLLPGVCPSPQAFPGRPLQSLACLLGRVFSMPPCLERFLQLTLRLPSTSGSLSYLLNHALPAGSCCLLNYLISLR